MRRINPAQLGAPSGYSNGILGPGGLLFVAGQVAWDQHAQIVSDHFAAQFERALENILSVVTEAGGTAESLMKLTIFVTDKTEYMAQRREIGEKYRRLCGRHYPAMTLVEVKSLLEPGARVEIEAVAVVAGNPRETR